MFELIMLLQMETDWMDNFNQMHGCISNIL